MERHIQVTSAAGSPRQVRLLGYPDECPRCHAKLVPKLLGQAAVGPSPNADVEEVFQCTNGKCERLFVAIYQFAAADTPPRLRFARAVPYEPFKPSLPVPIAELSPTFVDVYSQALVAESLGLPQLTGIGLRKALEFLIKDFAISKNPADREAILPKPLATCITDYIPDHSVKEVAKRAAWLGNDETHYLRKWEDKDINDLKVLISLSVNGIHNILLSEKYVKEMPA